MVPGVVPAHASAGGRSSASHPSSVAVVHSPPATSARVAAGSRLSGGRIEQGDFASWLGGTLVGDSPAMQRVRALVSRLARTEVPVVVQGPTGSGKELVAHALHVGSGRPGRLVAFNVCAIADGMFEDALFGHVRGAFTGAVGDSAGYLLEADCGSIFMDEIAGLPRHAQAKLLRAIETREFRPVGAQRDRSSQFRVIAATNENLNVCAAEGRFRTDFLHRLQGAVIQLPALDSRRGDISILAHHFLEETLTVPDARGFITDSAITTLRDRPWPGNVRELRQVVQCALALASQSVVSRSIVLEALELRHVRDSDPLSAEAQQLLAALDSSHGDVTFVAERLGVHRATVYRRLRRLGLTAVRQVPHRSPAFAG